MVKKFRLAKDCFFTAALSVTLLLSGCAGQGWQKFSADSVMLKDQAGSSPGRANHDATHLEIFIFADGQQGASQTVVEI